MYFNLYTSVLTSQLSLNPWLLFTGYQLTIRSRHRKRAQIAHAIAIEHCVTTTPSQVIDLRNHDDKPQKSDEFIRENIKRRQGK